MGYSSTYSNYKLFEINQGNNVKNVSLTAQEFTDSSGNIRSLENLYMDGAEVLTFSLQEVPKAIHALLEKMEFSKEEVDHFVLHQANKFMLEALRKKLGVPPEKLPMYLTSSMFSLVPPAVINTLGLLKILDIS